MRRHHVNSQNTKLAIAEALKELGRKGGANKKVTIDGICDFSGISRNTFYYHFANVIELMHWTISRDLSPIYDLDAFKGTEIRNFTANYLQTNRKFLSFALQYLGPDDFRVYYVQEMHKLIRWHIDHLEIKNSWQIDEGYKRIVSEIFSESVSSIHIMLITKSEKYSRETAVKCLQAIFDFAITDILAHEKDILIG
ncbi:MAG: TetR/AcrR family transcriptional regulator [Gracilibacteraceae bacterium]|jgi:AcrR family transcriptional regulator|nr:TetR/AcrR family transcriptional regulator [Gracilibacteraceae bacterium]